MYVKLVGYDSFGVAGKIFLKGVPTIIPDDESEAYLGMGCDHAPDDAVFVECDSDEVAAAETPKPKAKPVAAKTAPKKLTFGKKPGSGLSKTPVAGHKAVDPDSDTDETTVV